MIVEYVNKCDAFKILKGRVDVPIEIQIAPISKQPYETVAIDF